MRRPSWLVIVPLFVFVWLTAMLASGWPGGVAQATAGPATRDGGYHVALSQDDNNNNSNDNTNNNNGNTSDSGDNDGGDNEDGDNSSDGTDDNDNRDEINVVPVPVPVPAPAPPGPSTATSADQVSQCLSNGGTLVYQGPQGGIAVKSYQDNLNVTLARVDPATQPLPPGQILSSYIFRMTASPCGGAPYTVLPSEVNLAVSYAEELAAGRDESRFALMYFDGTGWTVAPKLFRDADNNHVSASVTGLGVYALVQQ